jgi:hypothetical protein
LDPKHGATYMAKQRTSHSMETEGALTTQQVSKFQAIMAKDLRRPINGPVSPPGFST